VYLPVDKAYTESGLDHLEWAKYHRFRIAYREDVKGRRLWGVELDFPCMNLREESDGKTSCAVYGNRPRMCRDYTGGKDFPDCGCAL
jgi:Fe-S-cluster containining protein